MIEKRAMGRITFQRLKPEVKNATVSPSLESLPNPKITPRRVAIGRMRTKIGASP